MNDKTSISKFFKSVAILTCWYGRYPWYFPYFIYSCSYNPTIDFFIITDKDNSTFINSKPENVKIFYKTLEDIKATASNKLEFQVTINSPYKLCDFKPLYGFLFPEIIKSYDFWGHADIDLIYGSIRDFITEEVLCNYDVISVRNEYVTGFFALYKNSEVINTLFKRSKDYQAVFQNSQYLGFDECSLLCDSLMEEISIHSLNAEIESMTHIVKNLDKEGIIRAYFDLHVIESIPGELEWNKGKLLYRNSYEILLYHLISFKAHPLLKIPNWQVIPDHYFINKFNFSK